MVSLDYNYDNRTLYGIKSDVVRYVWSGYFLLVFISSIVGDTFILIASIKYRAIRLHKVLIAIIRHIAVCDLMISVIVLLPRSISLVADKWVFGSFLCALSHRARYYLTVTSMLLICAMTSTKLLLLKYPLRSATVTLRAAHLVYGACWFVPLTIPVMILLEDSVFEGVYFSYRGYTCDYDFSLKIWRWLGPLTTVTFAFIPNCLVVITGIYLLIMAKGIARLGRENLKWQGIMATVLTAIIYCISVMPFTVYNIIAESKGTAHDNGGMFFHHHVYRLAVSFLYLNTMSNFYIYTLTLTSFRDFIRARMQPFFFTDTRTSTNIGKAINERGLL